MFSTYKKSIRKCITFSLIAVAIQGKTTFYVFPPATLSVKSGYAHEKLSFGIKSLPRKEFSNINYGLISLEGELLEYNKPYFKGRITNGWGNYGAYDFDADLLLGYAYPRFAFLTFVPLIGVDFNYQKFPEFWMHFVTPLVGIKLLFSSGPTTHFRFIAGYEYQFGWLDLHTRYTSLHRYLCANKVTLSPQWQLSPHCILGLHFLWLYAKAEPSPNTSFDGLTNQIYEGDFQVSYGF